MKTILLIRHAKSIQPPEYLDDFERTLTERGKANALAMAKKIKERNISIDLFISSPAKRTKKTCKIFSEIFKVDSKNILYLDKLYLASIEVFAEVITCIDDKVSNIAICGHNSGITEFANSLFDDVQIDNMPTASVFALTANTNKWKDFVEAEKTFLFFEYPIIKDL